MIVLLILLNFVVLDTVMAIEVCGRSAFVNYQDILIDTTGTVKKGEGLRYFLEKDQNAKVYLDEYQKRNVPKWYFAAMGSIGTGMLFYGLGNRGSFQQSYLKERGRRAVFISGLSILVLNYLIVRTLEYNNESYLVRAIEEYNKRNLPKIYFHPYQYIDNSGIGGGSRRSSGAGGAVGIIKDF